MSACLALLGRASEADLRLNGDERRMLSVFFCLLDGSSDCFQIIAVFHGDRLETERFHAFLDILGKCDIRTSLDGNFIGIIEDDQFGQSQCSCQRKRLGGNPLHHAAVAAQHECIVIDYRILLLIKNLCQMSLCSRHTDSHSHTGSQRSCGCFDADRVAILRMSRCQGTQLSEIHDIFF